MIPDLEVDKISDKDLFHADIINGINFRRNMNPEDSNVFVKYQENQHPAPAGVA